MTLFSTKTILSGCNLPLDTGRLRRPWPLSRPSVLPDRITIQPLGTRRRWEAGYDEIRVVEPIQLSLGQGVRLEAPGGDWYIYTYEAGALAVELAKMGVSVPTKVTRLKLADLPKWVICLSSLPAQGRVIFVQKRLVLAAANCP